MATIAGVLFQTVNDTSADVREASFEAIGMAMKVVGEKHLMPFLADVDSIKMTKVWICFYYLVIFPSLIHALCIINYKF